MFNKKEFEKYGLENENFGWGAEDDKRYTRLEKLGNDIFFIYKMGQYITLNI